MENTIIVQFAIGCVVVSLVAGLLVYWRWTEEETEGGRSVEDFIRDQRGK